MVTVFFSLYGRGGGEAKLEIQSEAILGHTLENSCLELLSIRSIFCVKLFTARQTNMLTEILIFGVLIIVNKLGLFPRGFAKKSGLGAFRVSILAMSTPYALRWASGHPFPSYFSKSEYLNFHGN